jgi:hypothetical protein
MKIGSTQSHGLINRGPCSLHARPALGAHAALKSSQPHRRARAARESRRRGRSAFVGLQSFTFEGTAHIELSYLGAEIGALSDIRDSILWKTAQEQVSSQIDLAVNNARSQSSCQKSCQASPNALDEGSAGRVLQVHVLQALSNVRDVLAQHRCAPLQH